MELEPFQSGAIVKSVMQRGYKGVIPPKMASCLKHSCGAGVYMGLVEPAWGCVSPSESLHTSKCRKKEYVSQVGVHVDG